MPPRPRPHAYVWIAVGVMIYTLMLLAGSVVTQLNLQSLRADAGLPPELATLLVAVVVALAAALAVYALLTDSDWAVPTFGSWGIAVLGWQWVFLNVAVLPTSAALAAMMNNRPPPSAARYSFAPLLWPALILASTYWYLTRQRAIRARAPQQRIEDAAA